MAVEDQDHLPEEDRDRLAYRDGKYVAGLIPLLRLVVRTWFRSEVTGMDSMPEGGALMVSNHSGGLIAMDVPVLAVAFHDEFGPDRPLYVLAHDLLFLGSSGPVMRRAGFLPGHPGERRTRCCSSGGVTIVFPGGDYDVFRPSSRAHVDRLRRTHGLRPDSAARRRADRSRGQHRRPRGPDPPVPRRVLAKLLNLERLVRTKYMPVTFGFPFGFTLAFPPNLPLPTKIRTQVLEPIDIVDGVRPRSRHRRGRRGRTGADADRD